jgi:hypothetical protein
MAQCMCSISSFGKFLLEILHRNWVVEIFYKTRSLQTEFAMSYVSQMGNEKMFENWKLIIFYPNDSIKASFNDNLSKLEYLFLYILYRNNSLATIGFGFSRIVSHKMTYVIFLSKITSLLSVAGFKMAAYLGHIFFIFPMKLKRFPINQTL